jgi:hypothetical protein
MASQNDMSWAVISKASLIDAGAQRLAIESRIL